MNKSLGTKPSKFALLRVPAHGEKQTYLILRIFRLFRRLPSVLKCLPYRLIDFAQHEAVPLICAGFNFFQFSHRGLRSFHKSCNLLTAIPGKLFRQVAISTLLMGSRYDLSRYFRAENNLRSWFHDYNEWYSRKRRDQ
jgi:hypothetical protein